MSEQWNSLLYQAMKHQMDENTSRRDTYAYDKYRAKFAMDSDSNLCSFETRAQGLPSLENKYPELVVTDHAGDTVDILRINKTLDLYGTLAAITVYPLLADSDGQMEKPKYSGFLRVLLQTIHLLSPTPAMETVIREIAKSGGVSVRYVEVDTPAACSVAVQEIYGNKVAPAFLGKVGALQADKSLATTWLMMVLLFMTKRVTPENCNKYIAARYRALFAKANTVSDFACPDFAVERCISLHKAITTNHGFRKAAFITLWGITKGSIGQIKNQLEVIMGYYRYAEMNHILMISEYIINRNIGVLSLSCLNDGDVRMVKAFKKLEDYGADGAYAKILYPAVECEELTRQYLHPFVVAAYCIAKRVRNSFQYFVSASEGNDKIIEDQVNEYMNDITKYSVLSAESGRNTRLGPIAQTVLIQEKLSSFNQFVNKHGQTMSGDRV